MVLSSICFIFAFLKNKLLYGFASVFLYFLLNRQVYYRDQRRVGRPGSKLFPEYRRNFLICCYALLAVGTRTGESLGLLLSAKGVRDGVRHHLGFTVEKATSRHKFFSFHQISSLQQYTAFLYVRAGGAQVFLPAWTVTLPSPL